MVSIECLLLSQLLLIMSIASKKAKTAKNILEKNDLATDTPVTDIASCNYFFYITISISRKAKSSLLYDNLLVYLLSLVHLLLTY